MKNEMVFIGVDPGTTGAIAFLRPAPLTDVVMDFQDPNTLHRLKHLVDWETKAYVEKAHSMPKQGVSTTFKFGMAYGIVQGWLQAHSIPYEFITPGKWWKIVADSAPKGSDKKAAALELARRLFPELAASHLSRKKDHNRAEALLIAEVCRRMSQ